MMTRAEDRATVGTDPSADPGAKTDGRAEDRLAYSARSSHPLRDWRQRDKSLAARPREMNLATPEKVARISGKMWPNFPERASTSGTTPSASRRSSRSGRKTRNTAPHQPRNRSTMHGHPSGLGCAETRWAPSRLAGAYSVPVLRGRDGLQSTGNQGRAADAQLLREPIRAGQKTSFDANGNDFSPRAFPGPSKLALYPSPAPAIFL